MRNSGGVQQHQNTHTQDERQDLCLEDGTSKIVWVGNCRILFLEEIWLQEREICTQQDVMDANNFNILWTEASWSGNKYLTPHYPNQGNRLYLKWTPSKTHNLILLKKKWNSISISDQEKKKELSLETHGVSLVLSQVGLTGRSSVKPRGHRVAVRMLERRLRNHAGFFLFVWTWGGVYGCGRLISMDWTCVPPSSWRRKESKGEEEGNENTSLAF